MKTQPPKLAVRLNPLTSLLDQKNVSTAPGYYSGTVDAQHNNRSGNNTAPDPSLCSYQFLREKDVLSIFPVSRATLWRMVREGRFTKPAKLSPRVTAWRRVDVLAWLEEHGGEK